MTARFLAWLRKRATFANVVSLIALFVALGGGAMAAGIVPPNSIGALELKQNSVGASEVQKDAIGLQELKRNAVGPQELMNAAVRKEDLAKQAVTQQALGKGAVGQLQLQLGAVGERQIKKSSVGSQQIKDRSLAPQEFKVNGLPEVGYASRELEGTPCPPFCPVEALGTTATNAGVLNLDIAPTTSGYTTSSGVVGAVAPSRLIANAQVVLSGNSDGNGHCRLALFHAGQTDQQPFAAGTNTFVPNGRQVALPLAGGIDVDPGSYNVRVQCYADANGTTSFARGSLTVSIAPR